MDKKTFKGLTFTQWDKLLKSAGIKHADGAVETMVESYVLNMGKDPSYVLKTIEDRWRVKLASALHERPAEEWVEPGSGKRICKTPGESVIRLERAKRMARMAREKEMVL